MSVTTRLQQSIATSCEQGAMCVHDRAGHGLSAIQSRLAAATPSAWRDAVVTHADADGWLTLTLVASDELVRVWHHADLSATLPAGTPISAHARYGVLAAGGLRINVAS